jgi:hypothetical protein
MWVSHFLAVLPPHTHTPCRHHLLYRQGHLYCRALACSTTTAAGTAACTLVTSDRSTTYTTANCSLLSLPSPPRMCNSPPTLYVPTETLLCKTAQAAQGHIALTLPLAQPLHHQLRSASHTS